MLGLIKFISVRSTIIGIISGFPIQFRNRTNNNPEPEDGE